jgi:hypothetical protein
MPTHSLHGVRFESVACLNPLLEASLLVACENAREGETQVSLSPLDKG